MNKDPEIQVVIIPGYSDPIAYKQVFVAVSKEVSDILIIVVRRER